MPGLRDIGTILLRKNNKNTQLFIVGFATRAYSRVIPQREITKHRRGIMWRTRVKRPFSITLTKTVTAAKN